MPKMGMCWFNTPDKLLINKPFVGPTNSFLQCKDDHYPKKVWPSFIMRSAGRFDLMLNQILINAEDRIGFQQSMKRLSFEETAFPH